MDCGILCTIQWGLSFPFLLFPMLCGHCTLTMPVPLWMGTSCPLPQGGSSPSPRRPCGSCPHTVTNDVFLICLLGVTQPSPFTAQQPTNWASLLLKTRGKPQGAACRASSITGELRWPTLASADDMWAKASVGGRINHKIVFMKWLIKK